MRRARLVAEGRGTAARVTAARLRPRIALKDPSPGPVLTPKALYRLAAAGRTLSERHGPPARVSASPVASSSPYAKPHALHTSGFWQWGHDTAMSGWYTPRCVSTRRGRNGCPHAWHTSISSQKLHLSTEP